MSQYVVYALCDPRFSEGDRRRAFYIGKSTTGTKRIEQHASNASLLRDDRYNWQKATRIRELLNLFGGLGYTIEILEELPSPPEGASLEQRLPYASALGLAERHYIKRARESGSELLNRTDGGENVVGPNVGKKLSAEVCRQMSVRLSGQGNPFFGRTHSAETRKKLSDINTGKKHSPEQNAKLSAAMKGRTFSAETRHLISEQKKGEKNPFFGKTHSDEAKKAMSDKRRGYKHPLYGKPRSPETLRKMAEGSKRAWAVRKANGT